MMNKKFEVFFLVIVCFFNFLKLFTMGKFLKNNKMLKLKLIIEMK